jgi:hypothetical protein
MAIFLKQFSKFILLDSLAFFLPPSGKNSPQKKTLVMIGWIFQHNIF